MLGSIRELGALAGCRRRGPAPFVRGVAIVTDTSPPSAPCGVCRETMSEFCAPEMPILLANPQGERRLTSLAELFPEPFRFQPAETSSR